MDSMRRPPSLPPRDEVVALCERQGWRMNGLAYNSQIWIKYGGGATEAEAKMQQWVHKHADRRIVHVPEVYDFFTRPHYNFSTWTYIVMERVEGMDYGDYVDQHPEEAETILDDIANAVRHIWSLPIPPGASPGPLDGQIPIDRFFGDSGPRRTFRDIEELNEFINDVMIQKKKPQRVNFSSEQLGIRHGDLAQHNILIAKPIVIFDWGYSGIYPAAFEEYKLFHQFNLVNSKFAKALRKRLFGEKLTADMCPMSIVANWNAWGY